MWLAASSHALADEELTTRVEDIRDLLVAPDEEVGGVEEFYLNQALG